LTAYADLTNCTPSPSGLVSWWPGEGSAGDSVGSNNGTLLNGASFAAGMVGQAFSFNGSNQCVQIPYAPSLVNSNYSVEAWVKPLAQVSDPINQNVIFGQSYGQCLLLARTGSTGVLVAFQFGVSHFTFYEAAGTSEIPIGQFTHLAGTWDGTTLRLYINGVLNAQSTPGASPVDSGCPFCIGGFYSPAADDCSYVGQFFNGLIDEVSYYQRSLSAAEIQAIYLAGGAGKCAPGAAPLITTQPASQTVLAGSAATFSVTATGTPPLSYQWGVNGTNITGATGTSLTLSNVQPAQAGMYVVQVTNAYGSTNSANAILTVTSPPCTPPPSGLVSWWRGEGDCLDAAGTNNGTLSVGASFASGEVGQAFSFDGVSGYVEVPSSSSLNPAGSFTIEGWIFPRQDQLQTIIAKWADTPDDLNQRSYTFNETPNESLQFAISDWTHQWDVSFQSFYTPTNVFALNTWSHVAAVYDQPAGARRIYVNGVEVAERIDPPITVTNTTARVGIGANLFSSTGSRGYFDGLIDELSFYSAALSTADLQAIYNAGAAGKCPPGTAPLITTQPASQTVLAGSAATFSVTATGSPPLSYQWRFSGSNITGATGSSLALTNVQPAQAGIYVVQITNAFGSTNSADALLTVTPPSCTPAPGGLVSWWQADGFANDTVGGNNGILVNGAGFGTGEVGQAFSFNGVNQYVNVPRAPSLDVGGQLTIDCWVNVDPSMPIGSRIQGLVTSDFCGIEIGGSLGVILFISTNSGGSFVATSDINGSGAVFPAGQWHHVAGTYDGSKLQFYLDGQPYGKPQPASGAISPMLSSSFVTIGSEDGRTYCPICTPGRYFKGLIDEVDIFNRALSASEIAAIYNAGAMGKCGWAAGVVVPPTNQLVIVGANVNFSVVANGTPPLAYQWQFDGTNVPTGTASVLNLTGVQANQAGSYAVVVTNVYGVVTSSVAVLTVNPPPPCVPPPAGLVSWWRGEGNASDEEGLNNGTLQNGVTFAPGEVGQAFSFDGTSGNVRIPRAPSLDVGGQFTLDCWVNVDPSTPLGSRIAGLVTIDFYGLEVGNGPVGVFLFMSANNGASFATTADLTGSAAVFPVGEWHHVAGTYDGAKMQLYLDGQAWGSPRLMSGAVSPMRTNSYVTLGAENGRTYCGGCLGARYFKGQIDEVDIFNRALSATEIAGIYAAGVSGKCLTPSAPYIYTQPANQVVTVGGSVTFSVGVAGTAPLSCQWSFGGSALDGATNASLTLTNVQFSQAGNYSVVITNVAGTASSSNATLSVNFPPALVGVVNVTNAQSGATVNVPVSLAANGNENGLSFSLDFDTNSLTYVSTALGSGASGATLLTNATQAASGKLGVILALPPGQTFAAGPQEMVEVTFMTAVRTNNFSTTLSFGDVPIGRELSDASGNLLTATYASGVVWIQAASFEGDVSPRPNGDKALTLRDWVQEGRFVAGLDYPTNASEFQRADCAPRATLGDGAITVIDWVQVGRYAAQLDPLTVAGGPTNYVSPGGNVSKPGSPPVTPHDVTCVLEVANTMVIQGLTGTASVLLGSMGNENALGFSLVFDPSALNYVSAGLGSASNGVTMFLNESQAGAGRLGFVLGLGAGQTFVAGTRELVRVTFRTAAAAQGNCPVSFAGQPVVCQVSDTNALPLAASYVNGAVTVNPLPSLSIGRSGTDITLAWPLWATNFGLQAAEGGLPPVVPWTNLVVVPTLTTNEAIVTLPLAATNRVYRLHQP